MNESAFRISAAIILLSAIGISIYFRSKADRESGERVSWKDEGLLMILLLRLGGLVLWFSAMAYLLNPAWLAWSRAGLPDGVRWLGAGIGLVSVGLVYWLFTSIGAGITPTVATRTEHKLVTHGPYRWVRHPLYSTGTLLFLAFSLLADSWWIALLAALTIMLLAAHVPTEEAHLIAKFGDQYREYMKSTGRFLPRLSAPRRLD